MGMGASSFFNQLHKQFTYNVKIQYNSIFGLLKQPGETADFVGGIVIVS
jgi:hypothetical protein